jgi:mannose-6-phosphate isomerase-like protein (cupin superfamily)
MAEFKVISMAQKADLIEGYWNPAVVAECNGQHIKLAKFKGSFTWHKHDNEDEFFYVVKGSITIRFREQDVILNDNECLCIPAGVEHCPEAAEEALVMLFEPVGTLNTGNVINAFTKRDIKML